MNEKNSKNYKQYLLDNTDRALASSNCISLDAIMAANRRFLISNRLIALFFTFLGFFSSVEVLVDFFDCSSSSWFIF